VTWARVHDVKFPSNDAQIFSDMMAGDNIQTAVECGNASSCQPCEPLEAREHRQCAIYTLKNNPKNRNVKAKFLYDKWTDQHQQYRYGV
jgi:hypothetical protein